MGGLVTSQFNLREVSGSQRRVRYQSPMDISAEDSAKTRDNQLQERQEVLKVTRSGRVVRMSPFEGNDMLRYKNGLSCLNHVPNSVKQQNDDYGCGRTSPIRRKQAW